MVRPWTKALELTPADAFADLDRPDSPGCAVGVTRFGEVLFERAVGSADIDRRIPLDSASIFDVGSVSKQVTAGAVLLLAEAGQLSLSDDIHLYLPEFPHYGARLTIDHLLHHTGGLPDYIDLLVSGGADLAGRTTAKDALATLTGSPRLKFTPGSRFDYSNSGYFLLGIILERVSGRSLREFADEHFFKPLGMTHSFFRDRHDEVISGLALGYAPDGTRRFRPSMSEWEQVGDGALYTTVGDLLRWADNLVTGGVGGEKWRCAMLTPGNLGDGRTVTYAGGLFIGEHKGEPLIWHGGQWAGYRGALYLLPNSRLAVAVACNLATIDAPKRAFEVLNICHAAHPQPIVGARSAR